MRLGVKYRKSGFRVCMAMVPCWGTNYPDRERNGARLAPPPPPASPDVIDLTQPDITQLQTSDLVEALPIMLVGIGVAYMVGVVSGAWIFSPIVD